ncbi:hypothetical protein [Halorussus amylolyticus]|uniref:hypothetical protein n=1 Tax=Halorussus amylolyticus TaxID=1126242 RepID=UPI00104A46F9|nr:hypothetical protein [Halorussus amylolyticus]
MARENESEKSNRLGGVAEHPNSIEISCPQCEGRWTHRGQADHLERTCPHCHASFSVRVHDDFALVEREGWAVAVSVSASGDHPTAGVAGDR